MKIADGFILRNIGGEYIVVGVGETAVSFNGIISLNASSKMVFEGIQKGLSVEQITDEFLKVYNVDRARAKADVEKTIESFKKVNIIDD